MQIKENKRLGIFYFICSIIIGCMNDVIMKSLSFNGFSYWHILFFRYCSSFVFLLPFACIKKKRIQTSKTLVINIVRGAMLFVAMYLWNIGLSRVFLLTSTVMSLFVPLIAVLFAGLILKENIDIKTYVSLGICFLGSYLSVGCYVPIQATYNYIVLLLAAFFFALLDVSYRKYSQIEDSFINTLLFSSLVPSIISFFLIWPFNCVLNFKLIMQCLILGIGNNAIVFLILKAYNCASIGVLAPYRYFDFFISSLFGYLFFAEILPFRVIVGASLIIGLNYLSKKTIALFSQSKKT